MNRVSWDTTDFVESLTSVADSTAAVYRRDIRAFEAWTAEQRLDSPDQIRRTHVRSYLAGLTTSDYARRTIARKASVLSSIKQPLANSTSASSSPAQASRIS